MDGSKMPRKTPKQLLGRYELESVLGEGCYAEVYAAKDAVTDTMCAVKVIRPSSQASLADGGFALTTQTAKVREPEFSRLAKNEAAILKRVGQHDHCVQLLDVFREADMYVLTMEKCECTLAEKLEKAPICTEGLLSHFVRQMLMGLAHIHSLGVVHRDVKPDNFLCAFDSTVKICDFGLAGTVRSGLLEGVFGTAPYMSPEMVNASGHDQSTDMWSFGAMLYIFLFGCFPYKPRKKNSAEMKKAIQAGFPEPKFKGCGLAADAASSQAIMFVRSLLHREASERLEATSALKDTFLAAHESYEPVTEDMPEFDVRAHLKGSSGNLHEVRSQDGACSLMASACHRTKGLIDFIIDLKGLRQP